MPADEEDDSFSVSDLETQFVSQEGDDQDVWAVNAILKERKNHYLVDWLGEDPETGKPWPPSWVVKHDCTDYLVMQWKKEKAKTKKEKAEKKRRGEQFRDVSCSVSQAALYQRRPQRPRPSLKHG